jgi:hypothetical protein
MTIEKINKITIVASSKFLTNDESLNFSNTLIVSPILLTKKPNSPKVHPSAAQPSSYTLRSAAFRPLLTEGLALSGLCLYTAYIPPIHLLVNPARFQNRDFRKTFLKTVLLIKLTSPDRKFCPQILSFMP